MWLLKLVLFAVAAYVIIVGLMYVMQTWMLFPTGMATGSRQPLPASTVRIEAETPDGTTLAGLRIPPARKRAGSPLAIVGFGGNAWNARSVVGYLHELYPDADVIAFHYRGYGPSDGSPSAAALLADGPVVYDRVREVVGAARVVGVGFSIGSSVAVQLAARRPLAGLILVTPFDSLEALAQDHYPWAPVRWLLRHRMPTAQTMRALTVPTALIAGERDRIVPPPRTDALRRTVAALVFDRTIAGAGHNDLYSRPDFRAAMAEALVRIEAAAGSGSPVTR